MTPNFDIEYLHNQGEFSDGVKTETLQKISTRNSLHSFQSKLISQKAASFDGALQVDGDAPEVPTKFLIFVNAKSSR